MLTIFQLRHLPLEEQAHYVWDHGEYSDKKVELMYTVASYWLGSFWAEVVYNNISNEIEEILFKEAFHNN